MVNAPHIDGIYYDGVNFDRQSFRRIRKLLDAGSPNPLIDIHTGEVPDEPSSVRYIGASPFSLPSDLISGNLPAVQILHLFFLFFFSAAKFHNQSRLLSSALTSLCFILQGTIRTWTRRGMVRDSSLGTTSSTGWWTPPGSPTGSRQTGWAEAGWTSVGCSSQ